MLLQGVNRSGSEFGCVKGGGVFDGPVDDEAAAAIASWGATTVRVPLNEDCWLGINGITSADAGANYQHAIDAWVRTLIRRGLYVILELQWVAPGAQLADSLRPMPDADHSAEFWRQVARAYSGRAESIAFDLYTEPWPDNNRDTAEAWRCWRDGGICSGVAYPVAGMQSLVDAVRGSGAANLILLGGVRYSLSLTGWIDHEPSDSAHNLVASWHIYQPDKSNCPDETCFGAITGAVLGSVPLVATEFGQTTCGSTAFLERLLAWLTAHKIGALAWTWGNWAGCEALITDYRGLPTDPFGTTVKSYLLSRHLALGDA